MSFLLFVGAAIADEMTEFQAYQKTHLGTLQSEFKRIRADHPNSPELMQFHARLTLIDEVTALLASRYQSTKSSTLQGLLEDVEGLPQVNARTQAAKTNYLNAMEVLAEYQDAFAPNLPRPAVPEKDLKILLDYYASSARVASNYIAERGRMVAAINPRDAVDVLQLCLVMPFLHVPDGAWSVQNIRDLPDWMKTPDNLSQMEDFSLRVRRTKTAYQFMTFRKTSCINAAEKPELPAYSAYLLDAATRLINAREYHAGIYCLRSGIAMAEEAKDQATAIALRFQLADMLSSIGHQPLAVQEFKELMNRYPQSDSYGKAAMLYLKTMYEAKQYKDILKECAAYQTDPRCEPYRPQILYVSWVTYRHEDQMDAAEKIQKEFLEKYPNLLLASDMYFASAMTALADSKYDEASRLLEIIEYRYPTSRTIDKVKDIRKRIAAMSAQKEAALMSKQEDAKAKSPN
jgi:TolA-binding protein